MEPSKDDLFGESALSEAAQNLIDEWGPVVEDPTQHQADTAAFNKALTRPAKETIDLFIEFDEIMRMKSIRKKISDVQPSTQPLNPKPLVEKHKDPQKLIALQPEGSEYAKTFMGSEWKNGQFLVLKDGKETTFPKNWNWAANGLNIRVKIMGDKVDRKLLFEISYKNEADPGKNHLAHLELKATSQVVEYNCVYKVWRIPQSSKKPKKGKRDRQHDHPSYWLLEFSSKGGTGYGLDYDSEDFDDETRAAFKYFREIASNVNADETVRTIKCQVNAHYIIREGEDSGKRRDVQFQLGRQLFNDFFDLELRSLPYPGYRSIQGKPRTHWNGLKSHEDVKKGNGGLIKYLRSYLFLTANKPRSSSAMAHSSNGSANRRSITPLLRFVTG